MNVGILMIFAFASTGSMSLVFAGWSSRNKYAMMSSMRAVSQAVAYEIPMLITTITVVMIAGSMDLMEIVHQQSASILHWNIFPLLGQLSQHFDADVFSDLFHLYPGGDQQGTF